MLLVRSHLHRTEVPGRGTPPRPAIPANEGHDGVLCSAARHHLSCRLGGAHPQGGAPSERVANRGCTEALREISARNRSCGWHCGGEPLHPAGLVCATLRKRDVTTVRVRLSSPSPSCSGPMTKNWDGELNAMMDRRARPSGAYWRASWRSRSPPDHLRIASAPVPLTPLIGRERELALALGALAPPRRSPPHPDRPRRHRQDHPRPRPRRRDRRGLRRRRPLRPAGRDHEP